MLLHGGHAAAHGFNALGSNFLRIGRKRKSCNAQIRVEHDGTMVHHAPFLHVLRVAGEFFAVDGNIVAAVYLGICAQCADGLRQRAAEHRKVELDAGGAVLNIGEIQVPQIVVHRAAAGKSAHDTNAIFADVRFVDFRHRVLMTANDHCVVILPEKKVVSLTREHIKNILFQCQIERRIGGGGINKSPLHK